MKSSELQIGDYVLVKPSMMPIKVAAVHHKKVGYHAVTHKLNWVRMDLLEPIPFTVELAKKNGFYFGYTSSIQDSIDLCPTDLPIMLPEKTWCYDNENGGEVTIEFPNESDGVHITISNADKWMEHIFEGSINLQVFQHLLRECGLNELADNFKVKA